MDHHHASSEQHVRRKSTFPMVNMDNAISQVVDACRKIIEESSSHAIEAVPILQAYRHVLAQDVIAAFDLPAVPVSIKDGYAVRFQDGAGIFPVLDQIHANKFDQADSTAHDASNPLPRLEQNAIAYIATGAPLPIGADAVVPIENTEFVKQEADPTRGNELISYIRILTPVSAIGSDVRPVGADLMKGDLVLAKDQILNDAEIGLLASCGIHQVSVYKAPLIGIMSTGDEVIDVVDFNKAASASKQIGVAIDSNRPMLISACHAIGAQTKDFGIVGDDEASLSAAFKNSLQECDILVTSGGVSMGKKDILHAELSKYGTIHFGRVLMKPGKPLTFTTIEANAVSPGLPPQRRVVLSLPGNPVSSFVCYHLVVAPAIKTLAGYQVASYPTTSVILSYSIKLDPERPEYQRAIVHWDMNQSAFVATSTGIQQSSRLLSARSANALLKLPARSGTLAVGSRVDALLLHVDGLVSR